MSQVAKCKEIMEQRKRSVKGGRKKSRASRTRRKTAEKIKAAVSNNMKRQADAIMNGVKSVERRSVLIVRKGAEVTGVTDAMRMKGAKIGQTA